MYKKYFGLHESPFSIAPDPRYLYMSELHREALAHLLYGISSDGCFILLTGDVGTGKTTVCRCLLQQLPENTDVALIVNPRLTSLELLESICDELEITPGTEERSAKSYFDDINRYLLDAHARGRNVALLIDEAQNLSLELLEQLRLLTNLETDQKKLLKIVLLGQTELRQIVARDEADQIRQRITSRYHLLPLEEEDVYAYVSHRLLVAGGNEKVFSRGALARIFELSNGIPRLINVLCDRALLGTYAEGKYLVTAKIVEQAGEEVFGGESEYRRGKKRKSSRLLPLFILFLCLLAGIVVGYWYQDHGAETVQTQSEENRASVVPQNTLPAQTVVAPGEPVGVVEQPVAEEKKETVIRIIPLEISE